MTNLPPGYPREVLEGLEVVSEPAPAPRYANIYDAAGVRSQLLLHPGTPLDGPLEAAPGRCDLLIVAPAYHELDHLPCIAAPVTGVALQGILRDVRDERVVPRADSRAAIDPFLRRGVFVFLSEEDTGEPESLAEFAAGRGAAVFLTLGERGAGFYEDGFRRHVAAIPAAPVEPTGAGDCFAAAFLVRFAETASVDEAIRYALAAGSLAVEGRGTECIPGREAIEARARKVAA